jgi:hypothetical protein
LAQPVFQGEYARLELKLVSPGLLNDFTKRRREGTQSGRWIMEAPEALK